MSHTCSWSLWFSSCNALSSLLVSLPAGTCLVAAGAAVGFACPTRLWITDVFQFKTCFEGKKVAHILIWLVTIFSNSLPSLVTCYLLLWASMASLLM